MTYIGVFNRDNADDIPLVVCVKYSQLVVDNWKQQPGKSGLTDLEAFDEIVAVASSPAQYTVITDADLPPYPYYMPGATYDFATPGWDYDLALIGAYVNDELVPVITDGIEAYMDAQAQTRGYTDIFHVVTYADEPAVPTFQAEGEAFRSWRSLVWAFCYTLLNAWTIGDAPLTADDIINDPGFPVLTLP